MKELNIMLEFLESLSLVLSVFLFFFDRIFSRIATIPFNKISGFQTLQGSLMLKASLQPLVSKAVLSVGTLLELKENFKHMQNDDLFKEVCTIVQEGKLDMRSQLNYALLLFSTGKVLVLGIYYDFVHTGCSKAQTFK